MFLASLSFGQTAISGKYHVISDSLRWGDSDDSTSYLLGRGNAIYRDSSGSWVAITADSCSKWMKITQLGRRPGFFYELRYETRTSSGNTDSTTARLRFDTRSCRDDRRSTGCDNIVGAGFHQGYTDVTVLDTLTTKAHTAGTTWKRVSATFYGPGGSQIRACVDNVDMGGATGDSTFFRGFVIRG
jgi:hypothetical protein